jgi:hypothetical protein
MHAPVCRIYWPEGRLARSRHSHTLTHTLCRLTLRSVGKVALLLNEFWSHVVRAAPRSDETRAGDSILLVLAREETAARDAAASAVCSAAGVQHCRACCSSRSVCTEREELAMRQPALRPAPPLRTPAITAAAQAPRAGGFHQAAVFCCSHLITLS